MTALYLSGPITLHSFSGFFIFGFFGFAWGGAAPQTPRFLAAHPPRPSLKRSFVTFDRGGQTGPPRSNDFFFGAADDTGAPMSTVRKRPKMAPIGVKLWENAFQTIPNISFFNAENFFLAKFFDENFFLYFEEIDLCKRIRKNDIKIYIDPSIKVNHLGGTSHNSEINKTMELSRNWHWMWSSFYYHKKHYGYIKALLKISPKLLSSLIKFIFYLLIFQKFKSKQIIQIYSLLKIVSLGNISNRLQNWHINLRCFP